MSDTDAVEQVVASVRSTYGRWGKSTTIAAMRQDWDNLFRVRAVSMSIERFDAGGVQAAWIAMPSVRQDCVVMYLHGGGFRLGSIVSHLDLMQRLSMAASARVLAVEYKGAHLYDGNDAGEKRAVGAVWACAWW